MAELLSAEDRRQHTGVAMVLNSLCKVFAVGGGLALIGMAIMSLVSIVGRAVFDAPLLGDYELVQAFCALAVSLSLPYTQWIGANVIVDFFTTRTSARFNAVLDAVSMLMLAGFSAVIAVRSWAGLVDLKGSGDSSMLLEIPTWIVYVPIVASFVLLVAVCLYGILEKFQIIRGRAGPAGPSQGVQA